MHTSRTDFRGEQDWLEMASFIYTHPAENLHVADLPYRFCSWAFDDPANASLWLAEDGSLLAWAVLQSPFWTLDFAVHPQFEEKLLPEVLAWAGDRAAQILDTPYGHSCWFAMLFSGHRNRIQVMEDAGFASQADVGEDSWRRTFLQYAGEPSFPAHTTPDGFTLRPFAGSAEVDAYVSLHQTVFETRNMTVAWRQRTLLRPEYNPNLDLVITAPDGRLVAFCIAWITPPLPGTRIGQVEPLGVHPDFRGIGLGHALLAEAIQRMQAYGAFKIFVETDLNRNDALGLYISCGFRKVKTVLVMRKEFGQESA